MNRLKTSEEQSEKLVQMVNEYSSLLYRTAYIYCKNRMDAEEIVQETYLKYLNKKPCFESKQHEKAWFLRVTINLCKDYLRCFWNRGNCRHYQKNRVGCPHQIKQSETYVKRNGGKGTWVTKI